MSIEESSQFASALLLCAQAGGWQVEVVGENADESPYVAMTRKLTAAFPQAGARFQIEPDASSASYFIAAACLVDGSNISIRPWPTTDWQVDTAFIRFLPLLAKVSPASRSHTGFRPSQGQRAGVWGLPAKQALAASISRRTDLGDSIMTAMVLAPFAKQPVRFTDLGRLRVQECERVAALRTELTRCGAKVVEEGDTLTVFPSQLHGAEIETYGDHRMAMCFAILGLKVAGHKAQESRRA